MKLFGRWDCSAIAVADPGVRPYICLDSVSVPVGFGRHASERFYKSKYHIVERLISKIMVTGHKGKKHLRSSGHNTGKRLLATRAVLDAFERIEKETSENPVAVFVKALENACPREEITTIEYGGARYPQAVECAPQRRIDIALRQMTQGAASKCFKNKKSLSSCLANEILLAYKMDQHSQAIAKKLELERQSDASR